MVRLELPRTYLAGLVAVTVVFLSSCGPAPAAPTAIPAATQALAAATATTVAPTATSLPSTATLSPTSACPCFDGLSTGLDNSKQARIRLTSAVQGAPDMDVYVNGMPALDGGRPQQSISSGQFSGWLYVTPGTYTVALVPHGGTLAQALFPPTDIKVAAGHRYTVVGVGQLVDKDVHPLVIDENAEEAKAGTKPTDDVWIEVNNMRGDPSIDETIEGLPMITNIPYGGVKAGICPHVNVLQDHTIVSGAPQKILYSHDAQCEPGVSGSVLSFNNIPNHVSAGSAAGSYGTSELNVLDFLTLFTTHTFAIDGKAYEFKTLLAAINKAGMHDFFTKGGPYLLMAPTDQAFAALSQDQLNALLNDPESLSSLLKAHLVDGYYPYGSLSGSTYGTNDRTLTNELGQPLVLRGDSVNGQPLGNNYIVGNGDRVFVIFSLLPTK